MDPNWRVQWDAAFTDWLSACRPTGTQCYLVFDWVLDVVEHGPPAGTLTTTPGVLAHSVEDRPITIFYLTWSNQPVVAVAEILSI